jgi:steroid delta-isomerase-like uncharacterized protein
MSTEYNRTLGYRWAEIWNHDKDLSVIDEIVDANFVSHSSPPGLAPGREGVKQWATLFRKAFPDIASTADDVIVEGDKVVERFTGSGTHQGEFFGIPPTGKHFTTTGINIFRIENGKIVELWANSDDLGVMQQLGVIPSMG